MGTTLDGEQTPGSGRSLTTPPSPTETDRKICLFTFRHLIYLQTSIPCTLYPVAIIIILKIILFEHKNTIVLVIFAVITVLSSGLFPFIKVSIVQYMAVQGLEVRVSVKCSLFPLLFCPKF